MERDRSACRRRIVDDQSIMGKAAQTYLAHICLCLSILFTSNIFTTRPKPCSYPYKPSSRISPTEESSSHAHPHRHNSLALPDSYPLPSLSEPIHIHADPLPLGSSHRSTLILPHLPTPDVLPMFLQQLLVQLFRKGVRGSRLSLVVERELKRDERGPGVRESGVGRSPGIPEGRGESAQESM